MNKERLRQFATRLLVETNPPILDLCSVGITNYLSESQLTLEYEVLFHSWPFDFLPEIFPTHWNAEGIYPVLIGSERQFVSNVMGFFDLTIDTFIHLFGYNIQQMDKRLDIFTTGNILARHILLFINRSEEYSHLGFN